MKEITREDREAIDAMVLSLFLESINVTPEQKAQEDAEVKEFCEMFQCDKTSPLAIMYRAFRMGLEKGLELERRIDDISKKTRTVVTE